MYGRVDLACVKLLGAPGDTAFFEGEHQLALHEKL
jgi:hypothetical protein